MDNSSCIRRTLAVGEFAVVEQCTCGAVHVTIGAVTMRMSQHTLVPLATTINEAARTLTLDRALQHRTSDEALS